MQEIVDIKQKGYLGILQSLHDGLYFVDSSGKITFWNKSAERISGFTAKEVIGRSCADSILTHMDDEGNCLCEKGCPLHATMEDKELRQATVFMHHKDGHRIPVSVRTSPLLDERGNVRGGIEIFTDVSAQEANAQRVKELEKLALLDQLTGLANRRYIEQEMESRLAEYERFGVPFGILFMDIDLFKKFNDTHGHDVGDEVLRYVSRTFTRNSRPFDLYGRWGGEEFIAVIRNVTPDKLCNIAERLRLLIEGAYLFHNNKKLQVTISIGATMAMVDDSIEKIVKRADEQLYISKDNGRNRVSMA